MVPRITFKCADCIYETEDQEELKAHGMEKHCRPEGEIDEIEEIVSDDGKVIHHCQTFEKSFKCKLDLEKHIEANHNGHEAHACTHCEEHFKTKKDLETHMEAKHFTNCPLCDLKFTDNEVFSLHIKTDHAPHCSTCDMKFTNKCDLEKHIEETHVIQIHYTCTVCNNS